MKTFAKVSATGSQSGFQRWTGWLPSKRNVLLAVGAACIFSSGALWAAAGVSANPFDDDAPDAAQKAADSRAVRLSSAEGQVQVVQDGQVIADRATANLPLFEGTQVITGDDGQAEVQLEDGSIVRLSPNTTLTFSVMQRQGTGTRTEVVLNSGLAYFELQPSSAEHSLRVNYGPAAFVASSFSVVRIGMDTPPGELAVFSGNVHLQRGDALQLDIHGGESLSMGASDLTRYNLAESIQPDSWDSWNADRDQVLNTNAGERTAASASLGNSGVGMSDLDANGNWYDVPGQGYVWSPYDAQAQGSAWDPYGYGQWVSYPRYGYVWASGYGWGYAPYQCGLWNYYDNFGWGWAPGSGGCSPWWGGGGWGYNIGNHPRGYLPPRRPVPGPGRPRPVGPRPGGGIRTLRSGSVIAVDRRPPGAPNLGLYSRPTHTVAIAGHTLEPLRPVTPRQSYDRAPGAVANHPGSTFYGGGMRPSSPTAGSFYHPAQSGARPSIPQYSNRSQSAPASHPSYSGGGGGASHPSGGGGGGGGGGHPSGGGGGGGGGGTHK
jgi:hypothetical protein